MRLISITIYTINSKLCNLEKILKGLYIIVDEENLIYIFILNINFNYYYGFYMFNSKISFYNQREGSKS